MEYNKMLPYSSLHLNLI